MKKRMLSMLVAVILLMGAFAVNVSAENTTVVQEWNIDLGDDIAANFYLDVPADVAGTAKVNVTVAGQTNTFDLSAQTPNAKGLYKVSVNVAAAQMTEDITLQLIAGETAYEAVSYSIQQYASYILAGNYPDDVKTLIKHMLNYGTAAQKLFTVKTDDLANAGYVLDYTAQYPADYPKLAISGEVSGIEFYGASLVMRNKVAVRYYFTADSVEDITFTVGETAYTAQPKDDMFYVEVPGIAPYAYADPIVLAAAKGEEKLEVTYSPLTYFVRMSQKGSDGIKALVNAMYGYYEAADAYVDSSIFKVVAGSWDLNNQYSGVITIENKVKDGSTVKTNASNYTGVSVNVKDYTPSKDADGNLAKGNFSMQIAFVFDDGQQYEVRIHNTDDGKYKLQNVGGDNHITGWGWQADLTTAQTERLLDGDGVEFAVKLVGPNAELWVDGTRMKVVALGEAYEGKAAQVKLCMNGNNNGQNIDIPYTLKEKSDAPVVQFNIAELTNGTVAPEYDQYQVGDTIFLTVTPNAGYSQKLYINGEPLLLGGNTNSYIFVATEEVYNITGSFEPDVFSTVKGNWSLSDQQHGDLIITSQKDGTAVQANATNYRGVTVKVKDYTPSKNEDGSLKQGNFSMQVALIFEDGKYYEVRIHNTNADGNYKLQNVGGTNNLGGTGWPWLADLTTAQKANLLDGDGAEFTVKLVDSKVELWIDGSRMKTIELGDGYEGQLAQVKLCMNGNTGVQNIHIPYELLTETADVQLNISELTNGTVTAEYDNYHVGDTVFLTVAADEGYTQKLYINDESLLLDVNTNVYSFVATEEVYNITGSFEPSIFNVTSGSWDLNNQHNGYITILNKKSDGTTVITNESIYKEVAVTVKDYTPSKNEDGSLKQGGFAMQIAMIFDDGKQYQVRLHNTDEDGNYKLQNMGGTNNLTGWKWQADLTAEQKAKLLDGDGVEFAVKLVGPNAELWVDGTRMKVVELGAAYDGKLAQVQLCMNGNKNGQNIVIPYTLKTVEEAPTVQFNIAELTNGTVTPDYDSYKVGDTVTLAVTADEGYSQKLYINGEPMLVDVTNNTCSFVATEEVYNITGSFEANLFTVTGGSWNLGNQHNGVITIMNKTKDGSTVVTNASTYSEVAVTVKDYTPSKNEDGSLKQGGFAMQIFFVFDDGKQYQVRLHNTDKDGNYKLQNMGEANSLTGWKWQADLTTAQKAKLLDGDGVEFKVKLNGGNAELWVDGTLMKTVALGDAYNGKLAKISLCMNGNKNGQNIEIPFALK